jgi:hypothetical protein
VDVRRIVQPCSRIGHRAHAGNQAQLVRSQYTAREKFPRLRVILNNQYTPHLLRPAFLNQWRA